MMRATLVLALVIGATSIARSGPLDLFPPGQFEDQQRRMDEDRKALENIKPEPPVPSCEKICTPVVCRSNERRCPPPVCEVVCK